jgi:hypothetical protein
MSVDTSNNVNNMTPDQVAAMQPASTSTSTNNNSSLSANNNLGVSGLMNQYADLISSWVQTMNNSASAPPDGLNLNPNDCFGVSSDPATAEEQLVTLMEWTLQPGFDKRDLAVVWVAAMIGFNIRLNQWSQEYSTNPADPNYDPSYATIVDTLNSLSTAEDSNGVLFSDMIVQNLAAMTLYAAYDKTGSVTQANAIVIAMLNDMNSAYNSANISNPVLTSFDTSVQNLLDPEAFDAWESQYLNADGTLVNGDVPFNYQCMFLSGSVSQWCADSQNTNNPNSMKAIESQSSSAWAGNMIDAGYSVIYVICLLLIMIMDIFYVDAAGVSAQLNAYTKTEENYDEMMIDSANPDMDVDDYNDMMASAQQVSYSCEFDPRLSSSESAGTAADQILAYNDPTQSSEENLTNWNNTMYPQTTYDSNGNPVAPVDTTAYQNLVTSLNAGLTSLTSYSQNLPTIMQQYMQMIQQAATTMQSCVTTNSDTINYVNNKSA